MGIQEQLLEQLVELNGNFAEWRRVQSLDLALRRPCTIDGACEQLDMSKSVLMQLLERRPWLRIQDPDVGAGVLRVVPAQIIAELQQAQRAKWDKLPEHLKAV